MRIRSLALVALAMFALSCSKDGSTPVGPPIDTTKPPPPISTKESVYVSLALPDNPALPLRTILRAIWTKDGARDSTEAQITGTERVVLSVPRNIGGISFVVAGDDRYFPQYGEMTSETYRSGVQSMVLIPRTWKVEKGVYTGQEVTVPLKVMLGPAGPNDALVFFKLNTLMLPRGFYHIPYGWADTSFPIPVGLMHKLSKSTITSADSILLWESLSEMESALGRSLFVPASFESEKAGTISVFLHDNPPSAPGPATGGSVPSTDGYIERGMVTFPSRLYMTKANKGVMRHEFMHALGFGHTCGWQTLMVSIHEMEGECRGKEVQQLSPTDVALFELKHAILRTMRRSNSHYGIMESLASVK